MYNATIFDVSKSMQSYVFIHSWNGLCERDFF